MSRPSQKTDQCLIEAAQALMKRRGLSRMNLREVAAKAKVNLGMFHYHFKTKDKFVRAVLQDTYEKFLSDFKLKVEGEAAPLEKLRKALFTLSGFTRENRQLFVSLMQDALNGSSVAREFVAANFRRHGSVVMDLIKQCQKDGSIRRIPVEKAMVFLMGAINMANLLVTLVEQASRTSATKIAMKGFGFLVLSDDAVRERVDMALVGLAAPKGGKR